MFTAMTSKRVLPWCPPHHQSCQKPTSILFRSWKSLLDIVSIFAQQVLLIWLKTASVEGGLGCRWAFMMDYCKYNMFWMLTIFDRVDISARTQSGQSRSPQNLNFMARLLGYELESELETGGLREIFSRWIDNVSQIMAFCKFIVCKTRKYIKTNSFTNTCGSHLQTIVYIRPMERTTFPSLTCSSDWRCSSRSLRVYWGDHCTGWIILWRSDLHWSGKPDSME